MSIAGLLCLAIWLGLALGRHGFWRMDQRLDLAARPVDPAPVSAIIPARNEAENIARTLHSLLGQRHVQLDEIIVVDDHSEDETAAIVRAIDDQRVRLVSAPALPCGWAGKLWALNTGVRHARHEILWFSDADIVHGQDVLASMQAHMQKKALALVSLMVRLRCETWWEKLLIPAFIFYFALIYPFRSVNDPASRIAAAAGGSILLRKSALVNSGGLGAIRMAVIDDCALGKMFKKHGYRIWLGLGERSRSVRGYDTLGGIWRMVARSAYAQLDYSWLLLIAAMAGLAISHLLPLWLGIVNGSWSALASLGVMAVIYCPVVRFCGLNHAWCFSLPLAALMFAAMTVSSAMGYHLGWLNNWRGRDIHGSFTKNAK